MRATHTLKSGVQATIIVRPKTIARLAGTCFRGPNFWKAGNFNRWNSVEEVFGDHIVLDELLAEINELWKTKDFTTHSLEILHKEKVGWASTAPLEDYTYDELESFEVNPKSWALRVKTTLNSVKAPRTRNITIIFEFVAQHGEPVAIVHSIYPGRDIGKLEGDITEREKCVFFDWEHPGE